MIGLEPANSSVYGRKYHVERNDLHTLKPFEKEKIQLVFTLLEGKEELRAVREEAEQLRKRG